MNTLIIRIIAIATITIGQIAHALPDDAPNVVVLFSDQHRMADFPGEEHTSVIAPNLDRLSNQGVRFQNAISNYPVCSPFRAMLLTGLSPYRTGVIDNGEPVKDPGSTMAHAFKKEGYHTGYIGKWHLQMNQKTHLAPFGFNESRIWANTNSHYKSRYLDTDQGKWVDYKDYNAFGMLNMRWILSNATRKNLSCYMFHITRHIQIFLMLLKNFKRTLKIENLSSAQM